MYGFEVLAAMPHRCLEQNIFIDEKKVVHDSSIQDFLLFSFYLKKETNNKKIVKLKQKKNTAGIQQRSGPKYAGPL